MRKLIELENDIRTVFVGDTHGDFDTTVEVLNKFNPETNRLVFLGDYVDRGPKSQENIDFLLELRKKHPENVILLLGNHEAWKVYSGFCPSSFWHEISPEEVWRYENTLINLPLAVSVGNIVALHGALPLIDSINDITAIEYDDTDKRFHSILWGDYGSEIEAEFYGRPQFNKEFFKHSLNAINKKVLIRAHQPDAKQVMFDDKCITLMTTKHYAYCDRRVAVVEKGINVQSAKDLEIITL